LAWQAKVTKITEKAKIQQNDEASMTRGMKMMAYAWRKKAAAGSTGNAVT